MRQSVKNLFKFGTGCPNPVCLPGLNNKHGSHFNFSAGPASVNFVDFIASSIAGSASNIPISAATSTGILVQSEEGLPVRQATSSGPVFAERVQTIGRGRVFLGVNVTNSHFVTLRGLPLDQLHTNYTHQDTPPSGLGTPIFENDVIEVSTNMFLNILAITPTLTYGLGDRVDIGVSVPVLSSVMRGTSFAQIMTFGDSSPHFFLDPNGLQTLQSTSTAHSSSIGVGDISARMKVALASGRQWGFGVLGDVRLPTGSEDNFRGTGHMGFRGLGIVSARFERFSPHLDFGYFFRSGSGLNDAFLVTSGFDQQLAEWATLAVDVISQWQVGNSSFTAPPDVILTSADSTGAVSRRITPTNIPSSRDDVVLGSLGFKFTTRSGLTVLTNALVPVHRGGLQTNTTVTTGLEWTF
jgi:hypothetical protein